MAVFQAEVGEATLGPTLGGAGEQIVQIVGAQGDGAVDVAFSVDVAIGFSGAVLVQRGRFRSKWRTEAWLAGRG